MVIISETFHLLVNLGELPIVVDMDAVPEMTTSDTETPPPLPPKIDDDDLVPPTRPPKPVSYTDHK